MRGYPWVVMVAPLTVACGEDGMAPDASLRCDLDADGDGAYAIACGGDDCDDQDSRRAPGNLEVCDDEGIDEDCDPSTLGPDVDGDGAFASGCCNGDQCGTDCADGMASINPAAVEVCDLIDQDCDGLVDEGVLSPGFEDADGDRAGNPSRPRMGCAFDGAMTVSMVDCADDDRRRHGQMVEICDGQDNDCDESVDEGTFIVSWYADADGDGFGDPHGEVRASCEPIEGFSLLPFDCDDGEAARSPTSPELCNGLDDDCDGHADYLLAEGDTEDDDGDGVADAACPGDVGRDCDDRDPMTWPGATELCDGVDNDCDGTVDEGVTELAWYLDEDRDGFGSESVEPRMSCERALGWALSNGDCDDEDETVNPGAAERCNRADDDCDGTVDEGAATVATYTDTDGDDFGTGAPESHCEVQGLRTLFAGDCDDAHPNRHPNSPELCDGADNDCDGTIDEGVGFDIVYTYGDADGDGFGADDTLLIGIAGCDPVDLRGRVTIGGDCDDGDPNIFPNALELCDATDQDCDDAIDEDTDIAMQYRDVDGDGFGSGPAMSTCESLPNRALRPGDCDDSEAEIRPGATEECNAIDDDCDGTIDEAPAGFVGCYDGDSAPMCVEGVCR